jgi:hypothetical protein
MDSIKAIAALSDLIEDFILSENCGLSDISGTRKDQSGDLLVDFVKAGQPEMMTIRISLSSK